jgi:hypothetical protein
VTGRVSIEVNYGEPSYLYIFCHRLRHCHASPVNGGNVRITLSKAALSLVILLQNSIIFFLCIKLVRTTKRRSCKRSF